MPRQCDRCYSDAVLGLNMDPILWLCVKHLERELDARGPGAGVPDPAHLAYGLVPLANVGATGVSITTASW
jgi:hypothetical protein